MRKQVEELYGTSELYTGGLRVHVTMDPQLQAIAERVVRRGLIDLERQWLGFRRPPNVLDEGLAQSPDAYQDPSWNHLVLQPAAIVRAVVQPVTTGQATLRFASHNATLSLDGAAWTRTGSLSRILRPGDLVLVGLPDVLPIDATTPIPVDLLQEPKVEGALVAIHPQCRHFLGTHRWPLYWSLSELRACSDGGDILFLVCCTQIVPKDIRDRYKHTLVLHESDLPRGRGWSPLAWQILEGKSEIVISMCEAEDRVDSGPIWLKGYVKFEGHETNEEIHEKIAKKKLEERIAELEAKLEG